MAITISAEDPRSIKALEIAAGADKWLKVTVRDTGELAFGIPSQCARKPGLFYVVTNSSCNCEDFQRHGLSTWRIGLNGNHHACKHVLAVQVYEELVRAQQRQPRAKRRHLRPVPTAADYDRIFNSFYGED